MVARAVSPTRAATSTRFAAATIPYSIADPGRLSIEDSSACAKPFARDYRERRSNNAGYECVEAAARKKGGASELEIFIVESI
jgi:hypothetical protein